MYNNEHFNNALKLMQNGMFEQAFLIYKEMLSNNLTDKQKFNLYFEMSICKAELEEYSEAEQYVSECISIDESPIAYELIETIYELDMHLPNNLELAQKVFDMNKEPYLGMKLIHSYYNNKAWDKVTQMDILPEYWNDLDIINTLHDSFVKTYQFDIAHNFLEFIKQEITDKVINSSPIEPYLSHTLRAMFSTLIYYDIADDNFINIMNLCYNTMEHINNNTKTDIALFKDLKIGFLSSDFIMHPVGLFFVSFIEDNKSNNIRYHAYYTNDITDSVTEVIKCNVDKFYTVNELNDEQFEQFILDEQLDILVDLNGSSNLNRHRNLKNRLAPIQISWIGWPMTTCLPNMDYIIVDKYTAPKDVDKYYTEKLIRMNNTTLCNPIKVSTDRLASPFLKNGYITFGSFNNPLKYSKDTLECYKKILERLPDSKILIISSGLNDNNKASFLKLFENAGISLDRLILQKALSQIEYLEKYNDIDIILDTYPFNGATTTGNALCYGAPVISLYGKHHVSRVGLSMLNAVGLSDLAVDTPTKYIEKAIELASDKDRLLYIHQNLRRIASESALNDRLLFRNELETRFRDVYIDYCMNQNRTLPYNNNIKKELKNAIEFIEKAMEFFNNDTDKFSDKKVDKMAHEIYMLLYEHYQLIKDKNYIWIDTFNQSIKSLKEIYNCTELLYTLKLIWNNYINI